jgi:hypothetical protein
VKRSVTKYSLELRISVAVGSLDAMQRPRDTHTHTHTYLEVGSGAEMPIMPDTIAGRLERRPRIPKKNRTGRVLH